MGPRLQGFPFVLILSSVCIICFSFVVSNLTVVSFVCMAHRTRRGTNNSAAAMLDSNQPSSSADPPSSAASPPINSNPVTTPPSVILSQQDLSRAFSQALGDTLPRIVAALQSHSSSSSAAGYAASDTTSSGTTSSGSAVINQPLPSSAGQSSGNLVVPPFISTYCTLGNSSLSSPSVFGSRGAANGLPSSSQSFTPLFSFGPNSTSASTSTSLNRPFVVGPGYSPIPEKLVTKIRSGQFVDLADLLAENLKAQETEPQTYFDGKLLVSSSKKRVHEITDIMTWVEAFTVYSWIFCCAHPSRWQDMTQYKLLILKTSRQFPGKAWLHYDIAFRKDAAAAGLVDWSRMNHDLYNFHTLASPHPQSSQQPSTSSPASASIASSSTFCHSWNDGACRWTFGQCRYRHRCEKCEGDHPRVNCPFRASTSSYRRSQSTPPSQSKRQRR